MTMATRVVESTPCKESQRHKVLLVHEEQVVLTQNHSDTGPVVPILAGILIDQSIPHAYVCGVRLFEPLAKLNEMMQYSVPGWKMRITNRQRRAFFKDGSTRVSGRFFVDYVSISRTRSNGSKHSTARVPTKRLDVLNLDLLQDKPPTNPQDQWQLVLALLELCDHRGIRPRGTKGGIGTALLKKSPYWYKGRKPAPRFINRNARPKLPGNHYSISQKVEKMNIAAIPHCFYVDQENAHHNIANSLPLPHPESVHARGRYKSENGIWCKPNDPTGQSLLSGEQMGLVLAKIETANRAPTMTHLYPSWANKGGSRKVWLWTPELRLFAEDHRLHIDYFVAAYTATQSDPVLREYSDWALEEIRCNADRSVYKKGTLLSAYGMLAFNYENRKVYRYWGDDRAGPRVELPIGGLLRERKLEIAEQFQPSIVNVLARGLIEAETRTRSLEYAKELSRLGFHIPQIYADGILVETHALPFLPPGWRITHSLTNVYIPRPNALISDQITKLPGVRGSEDDRAWEEKRERARVVIRRRADRNPSLSTL